VRYSTEAIWHYHRRKLSGTATTKERNRLVEANQGLVRKEAHRWHKLSRETLEDLIQVGNIGLIKAIDRCNPNQGNFSTFALQCIRSEIQHYLRDKGWGVMKPPRKWVETVAKVRRLHRESQKVGRNVSEVQIAAQLGISARDYQEMVASRQRVTAIPEGFDVPALEADGLETVTQAVGRLDEPYHSCIVERYFHQASLQTLARQHGVKQTQIKLWLQQGLDQLRDELQAVL